MRTITLALLACVSTFLPTPGHAQEIERVEPPFWWTGFEHPELQLMLHGNNLSLLTPAIEHPGISISRVVRVESPNYLFIYLALDDDVEPGVFDIVFNDVDKEQYPQVMDKAAAALRPGGLLISDNMLWYGSVLDPDAADAATRGVCELTRMLYESDEFQTVMLPLRDGVTVSIYRS